MMTKQLVRVLSAEPLEEFCVRLGFTDNTQRIVDLEPYLHGPIFEPIRDDPHGLSIRSSR